MSMEPQEIDGAVLRASVGQTWAEPTREKG
jgi:hypothetical protein